MLKLLAVLLVLPILTMGAQPFALKFGIPNGADEYGPSPQFSKDGGTFAFPTENFKSIVVASLEQQETKKFTPDSHTSFSEWYNNKYPLRVKHFAIHPQGAYLAAAVGRDRDPSALFIWDVKTRKLTANIAYNQKDWGDCFALSYSNDGTELYLSSERQLVVSPTAAPTRTSVSSLSWERPYTAELKFRALPLEVNSAKHLLEVYQGGPHFRLTFSQIGKPERVVQLIQTKGPSDLNQLQQGANEIFYFHPAPGSKWELLRIRLDLPKLERDEAARGRNFGDYAKSLKASGIDSDTAAGIAYKKYPELDHSEILATLPRSSSVASISLDGKMFAEAAARTGDVVLYEVKAGSVAALATLTPGTKAERVSYLTFGQKWLVIQGPTQTSFWKRN